jgi:NADPH-dependent 2,4-dienoyl-CoA reductase/sulfur reductase-like enzyme
MKVVVVGASLSGLRTVEALRSGGFDGEVILAGSEEHLPYDRPPLSKQVLVGKKTRADADLLSREELDALDVDLRLSTNGSQLDLTGNTVRLNNAVESFDHLVIATGAHPRRLPFGQDLMGVHTLRTVEDCAAIAAGLERTPRVVVIGGGFIGSEVAWAAVSKGCPTTVLEMLPTPLFQSLGPEVGAMVAAMQGQAGINLITGHGATSLADQDGRVSGVVLDDGRTLPADLVVVGVGVVPETAWLEDSGLKLDNGVVCDERLRASGNDNIRAVGDVARWYHPLIGRAVRVEHWTNAAESASHAAAGILGSEEAYGPVLYVWSDQLGHRLQLLGLPQSGDGFHLVNGQAGGKLVGVYEAGGRVTAALGIDFPGRLMRYRDLLEKGASLEEAVAFGAELERS